MTSTEYDLLIIWADEKKPRNLLALFSKKLHKKSITTQEFLLPNLLLLFANVSRAQ